MYATYSYIDSDDVLFMAKTKLGLKGVTTCDSDLRLYMQRALGELPSFRLGEYKNATLTICDTPHKMAVLPCDFVRFCEENPITLNDDSFGCYHPRTVNNVLQKNTTGFSCNGNVQMVNGNLYFDSDVTATEVGIYYLAVITDEFGRKPVPESHAESVEEYMCYMYYRSIGDRANAADAKWRWSRGKKWVKAKYTQPNTNEKEEIFLIRNSIL